MQEKHVKSEKELVELPGITRHCQGMAWKTSFSCVDFWYFFNTKAFCGYVKNAIFDRFCNFLARKQVKNIKNAIKKTINVTIRKYWRISMFGDFPPFSAFFGHFMPFLTIFLKLPCWVAIKIAKMVENAGTKCKKWKKTSRNSWN